MGLLSTIKSILGMNTSDHSNRRDVEVTVEREPSAESERAVKEESPQPSEGDEPVSPAETDAAGEAAEPADATPEATGATAETAGSTGEAAEANAEAGEPLQSITGIGDAYAERLEAAGIEDVADLASAEADALAEETDISATRLEDWIEQAAAR
ncbi:MAG: helix-hairpin-helix domain-containing protein [Halodesulfurarchaeum sp.]